MPGGARIDNHFDRGMTEGELSGARVRDIDQITGRSQSWIEATAARYWAASEGNGPPRTGWPSITRRSLSRSRGS